ncbi:class II aldolase/adducin family protein [bacterium CPR1]|nr:class II aldolase/adducin family protein [bacterium CPR1]
MSPSTREVIRWGQYASAAGCLTGKSGNLSVRDGAFMAITASGSFLGNLRPEDVIRCSLLDGRAETGKPSMESEMHRLLYEALPEADSVFHSSPFYSTLLACTGAQLPLDLLPETMAYIQGVVRIPYFHPGSPALAQATASRLGLGEVGLLKNHGVIMAARSLEEAVVGVETFEILCRMLVVGRAAGLPLQQLPNGTRADFLDHLARLRSGSPVCTKA